MTRSAMFPLGVVLLPGGPLPLHVFEPRYREMLRDCLAGDGEPEFGQVLITRGNEAGGGDERAMVGTVARLLQVESLDDGRSVLLAVGTRRIRVLEWLPDDPYPVAEVEDWPDEDDREANFAERVAAQTARVEAVRALAARFDDIGPVGGSQLGDVPDDPFLASYHLAELVPIGPADRYKVLTAAGPGERLRRLEAILDDVEAMLRFRLS